MNKPMHHALLLLALLSFAQSANAEDAWCKNHYILTSPPTICAPVANVAVGIGPNRWAAIGPDGADVVALTVDPDNSSTAYAATFGAGILKTADRGSTWLPVNQGLPTSYVAALAIDPTATTTLYAGTDVGVFRSSDAGQHWVNLNAGPVGGPLTVSAVAIDASPPRALYAATSAGLLKTSDGGATWTPLSDGLAGLKVRIIALDRALPGTIYAVVDDNERYTRHGVMKSANGGATWSRVYTTEIVNAEDDMSPTVATIVIDPRVPSRLYVAVNGGGLVRSDDGGLNWTPMARIPSFGPFSLAIDPASATLYAGTYAGSVYRISSADEPWQLVADITVPIGVVAPATSETLYAGGSIGIFRSADRGQTWTRLTLGVTNRGARLLAADPTTSSTLYAQIGFVVSRTTDGGMHWTDGVVGSVEGIEGFVRKLVIDPSSPSTLYAVKLRAGSLVYKSTDGGGSWAPASEGLGVPEQVHELAVAPSHGATLYVAATAGVYKSVDGASSWARASRPAGAVWTYAAALAVDPTNADVVYMARASASYSDADPKIFKTTNGAADWTAIPNAFPPGALVTSLVIDPATPSKLYAAYIDYGGYTGGALHGGVYKSSDGGATWAAAKGLLRPSGPGITLAIDPSSPSRIYAATAAGGVFMSADAADTWTPNNAGLPTLNLEALAINRTGTLLRTDGLFEYRVEPMTVVEYRNVDDFPGSPGGQFFYTDEPAEQAQIDRGGAGRFIRTGRTFRAGGTKFLCRFFGSVTPGPNAHFYTISDAECDALKAQQRTPAAGVRQWNFEGPGFAEVPLQIDANDAACPGGSRPVFRAYNNAYTASGFKNPWESAHRYTTTQSDIVEMVTEFGWRDEGIVFCAPQ